jgi:hypothetical protein
MNKPGNIITTPSGDQMVVLPLAEYERLVEAVEDAADIRAYDAAKRRLARGATSPFRPNSSTVFSMEKTRFGFGASTGV